ncbi:O-antigen ligase family protein [bacterium]|nr:O-antigen ligase family protein [bacterium]
MLTAFSKNGIYKLLCKVLLFLVLVGLPLTSFPLLSRLSGGALVAPFSFIPLVVLLLVWLVPYLLERGKFPAEVGPLFYFVLVAIAVSLLAFFLNGYYARGRDFFGQSLRAFVTLAIGLSFYLFFSVYPQNEKGFQQVLRFIYIGGVLLIGFSLLEFAFLRIYGSAREMPAWFMRTRAFLAYQSPSVFIINRIAGLSYEPSWYVREFNLVLFPLWLSAVYQRKSIFKWRLWIFQVEDFLMLAGLVVFGLSSPRIGLLAFLASLAYVGLMLVSRLHGKITDWYLARRKNAPKNPVGVKVVLAVLMVVVAVVAAGAALFGYMGVASQWDYRYESLFSGEAFEGLDLFPLNEDSLIRFSEQLSFMERMIYWFGGWHIFNDYPLGVGLGNAGFYFNDRVNGQAFKSFEMRNLIYRASYLSNTKNLWVRLLSETGFPGLVVFLVWLIVLWRSSALMRKRGSGTLKIVGLAGQLFLLAYILEGFSMDSFAMPYQWLMAGLISAGGMWVRKQEKNEEG